MIAHCGGCKQNNYRQNDGDWIMMETGTELVPNLKFYEANICKH